MNVTPRRMFHIKINSELPNCEAEVSRPRVIQTGWVGVSFSFMT